MHTHSRVFGTGPRHALAIHCSLAHAGAWAGLGELLGDQLSITAMDMPGHGRSGPWTGEGDIQDATLAEAAKFLTGPMDVIGHSFGGTVALRLAVEHPELVRTLTLVEPVFFAVAGADGSPALAQQNEELRDFDQAIQDKDFETAARSFNRVWGDGRPWDSLPETLRDYMIERIWIIPEAKPALYDDRSGLLEKGVLDRVSMPVLIIDGDQTHAVMKPICDGLAARLPDARRLTVEGAGHMVPISHANQVAAAVKALIG